MKRGAMGVVAVLILSGSLAAAGEAPAPPAAGAAEAPKSASALEAPKIGRVTVYEDRALVTRAGRMEVAPGKSSVSFKGFPVNLDDSTLRAKVLSPKDVKLAGITSILENVKEEPIENVKKLQDAIEAKTLEIRKLQDEFQALSLREQKLNEYREYVKAAISETTTVEKPAVDKWGEALKFLREEPDKIAEKRRDLQKQQEDRYKELGILQNQLGQIQAQPERTVRIVTIDFESGQAQPAEVEVSYLVVGVAWRPEYDARYDEAKKETAFTYVGSVHQKTGEDWNEVELALSTARPSIGAMRPEVALLELEGVKIEKPKEITLETGEEKIDKEIAKGGEPAKSPARPAAPPLARMDDKGTSVTLTLTNPSTIPTDGRPHKVAILTAPLPTEVVMETVPKLKPVVYHKATATNKTGYPLLAGPVHVFRSSGFVGTGSVEYVPVDGQFSVSLGADDQVKVRRVFDRRKFESPKLFGSTKEVAYAYDIELRNYKPGAQRVILMENIPVSELAAVKVTLEGTEPAPTEKKDNGILKWDLTLKPGEKKSIRLSYSVRMPTNYNLPGY